MVFEPDFIKEILRHDKVLKNIYITFPNDERQPIDNDNIIKESVKFTESICSQNKLKFGLCENSCLRFSCVDVENITGMEILAYYEIDITSAPAETRFGYVSRTITHNGETMYLRDIPMGRFIVQSAERDATMKRRDIVAYSVDKYFEPQNAVKKYFTTYSYSSAQTVDLNVLHFILSSRNSNFEKRADFDYTALNTPTLVSASNTYSKTFGNIAVSITIVDYYRTNDGASATNILDMGSIGYIGACPRYALQNFDFDMYVVLHDADTTFGVSEKTQNAIKKYAEQYVLYPNRGAGGYFEWGNFYPLCGDIRYAHSVRVVISKSTSPTQVSRDFYFLESPADIEVYTVSVPSNKYPALTMKIKTTKIDTNVYWYGETFNTLDIKTMLVAYGELNGWFAGTKRNGYVWFYDIDYAFDLFPSYDIYPADDLYPASEINSASLAGSDYISAWHDDRPTRYISLTVTYINTNDNVAIYTDDFKDDIVISDDIEYYDYDLSSNMIIQHNTYTTSAIRDAVSKLADILRKISYYKANIKIKGMPYFECGDALWIRTQDDTIATIILNHSISGIQDLRDNIVSK